MLNVRGLKSMKFGGWLFGWGARGELDGVVFDKAYAVEECPL